MGCGVLATRRKDTVEVRGDPAHPANRGKLCVKGSALGETVGLEDRLLYPQVRGERVPWAAAIAHVAARIPPLHRAHGPESVAFYVSGQLLTEDYYVANKLMKGYVGAANIDTNSRLCMASAVAGHKRAFGEDVVPVSYEDLDAADLVVLVGSNTAWCHPILLQRLLAARERRPRMKIVALDPRRTATTQLADLHLPLAAGTDVHLFNGLLVWLEEHGGVDRAFVDAHTQGWEPALQAARAGGGSLEETARACGLDVALLQRFYEMFAATPAMITAFSQGVNQSSSGTDKVNAIINCHLATGRIGKPGAGPFSVTGQPNAMGGREVGGFVNTLAAHIDIEDAAGRAAVQQFWGSPAIATRQGPKAVEMFERIHDGRIKAVWIMATNPVVSLPDADRVKRGAAQLRVRGGVGRDGQHRHRGAGACVAAGAGLGREGRHGHQFRPHHLAPAAVPAAARRGARGLAHHLRRGARHGIRRIRFRVAARDLPRARAAHRACQRRPARARPRRLGRHHRQRIHQLAARGLAHG